VSVHNTIMGATKFGKGGEGNLVFGGEAFILGTLKYG